MQTMLEDAWDEVQNMCDTWVYEALGAEIDRLTTERAEVMEEAKVWQDRYRKRGYVMDEHAKALERAEIAEAELARYKQGVEVEVTVDSFDYGDTSFICEDIKLPSEFRGQRVRVLVMKEEG